MATRLFKMAIVGATGLVGREMLNVLEERQFPVGDLKLFASEQSTGTEINFAGETLKVQHVTPGCFDGIDLVLMSAGSSVSHILAPVAAKASAIVIDNSSQWRMHNDVPLIVPEVNAHDIKQATGRGIIANPNCAVIQLVTAISPLHQHSQAVRLVVTTYQAVSGAGRHGLDELGTQITALFAQQDIVPSVFAKRIAFNCLPHIGTFDADGYTSEEHKIAQETQKILHASDLGICATCVRVPVFNGHALSVVATFEKPVTVEHARQLLQVAPGVLLWDETDKHIYPTSIDAEGTDATLVGRIRLDTSLHGANQHGLALWCVADNLRKGAASNAVQIAEIAARDLL